MEFIGRNHGRKQEAQTPRDYSVILYVPCETHGWHRWSETIQVGIFPEYLSLKDSKPLALGRRMRAVSMEEYADQMANFILGKPPKQGALVEITFVPKAIREYSDARMSTLIVEGEIEETPVDVSTLGAGSPFDTVVQPEVPPGWSKPPANPHLN